MIRIIHCIQAFGLGALGLIFTAAPILAQTPTKSAAITSPAASTAPTRTSRIFFVKDTFLQGNFTLLGMNPENKIEFSIRRDEVITQAVLSLQFTPSPSLIPL